MSKRRPSQEFDKSDPLEGSSITSQRRHAIERKYLFINLQIILDDNNNS